MVLAAQVDHQPLDVELEQSRDQHPRAGIPVGANRPASHGCPVQVDLHLQPSRSRQDVATATVVLVLHAQASLTRLAKLPQLPARGRRAGGRDHGRGNQVAVPDRLVGECVQGHSEL
jgi:hypothetical protein